MNNRDRVAAALLANSQTSAGQMSPYAKPGASGFNRLPQSPNVENRLPLMQDPLTYSQQLEPQQAFSGSTSRDLSWAAGGPTPMEGRVPTPLSTEAGLGDIAQHARNTSPRKDFPRNPADIFGALLNYQQRDQPPWLADRYDPIARDMRDFVDGPFTRREYE